MSACARSFWDGAMAASTSFVSKRWYPRGVFHRMDSMQNWPDERMTSFVLDAMRSRAATIVSAIGSKLWPMTAASSATVTQASFARVERRSVI